MSLPVTSMVTEPHTCNRLQDFRVLCRCAYGCDIVCPPLADIPQPPGAIRLEENVPNTVTVTWEPSASEQWEKNLYYTVLKRESQKGLWHVLGDLIYNNKFTFTRVVPGRDYYFRVVAKNDVGASDPSETVQPWRIGKKKGKTFSSISLCCVLFLSLLLTPHPQMDLSSWKYSVAQNRNAQRCPEEFQLGREGLSFLQGHYADRPFIPSHYDMQFAPK